MNYEILNIKSVLDYCENISVIKDYFQTTQLSVSEIGDGNLNFVYLISSKENANKKLILKQAIPYLRLAGENWKLSKDRMIYEIRSLKKFYELCPTHIPKIYHSDEAMCLVVMQYLENHHILRTTMMEQKRFLHVSKHLGDFLSKTLFFTSALYLNGREKRNLESHFKLNTELCNLTEELIFSFPYFDHPSNKIENGLKSIVEKLQNNLEFKTRILELKHDFLTSSEALLHGDFHTGSIMISKDTTYVIDSEFSFYGPMGFDLGLIMANYLISAISHHTQGHLTGHEEKYAHFLENGLCELLQQFERNFIKYWNEHTESALFTKGYLEGHDYDQFKIAFMKKLWGQASGFCALEMLRRQIGLAGTKDNDSIIDEQTRIQSKKNVILKATQFLLNYKNISSILDIKNIINISFDEKNLETLDKNKSKTKSLNL